MLFLELYTKLHTCSVKQLGPGKPAVYFKELWTGEEGQGWDINHGDSRCPLWWEVMWFPSPAQSIAGKDNAAT